VGGGYIAVEFAGIFHGLGSAVTLMYRGELMLRGFDEECREHLQGQMSGRDGLEIRLSDSPQVGWFGASLIRSLVGGSHPPLVVV
jgi:glutathione reductase (NADPH)